MHRWISKLALLILALTAAPIAFAQTAAAAKKPPHAVISIYRIAPGKHVEFLKWIAAREGIDKEVGIAATQWYAHTDGDAWDYVSVGPATSSEQDDKLDAALKKHGLTSGFKQHIEIRQFIAAHTDTFAVGPVSAAELVDAATK